MTEPLHDLGHAFHPQPVGQLRPLDHDHGQSQFARGIDLGARTPSPGVPGNDPLDTSRADQLQLTREFEWSARHDYIRLAQRQLTVGSIDQSQCIDVLRFGTESADVLPPNCEKNPGARIGQSCNSRRNIGHLDPLVAGGLTPRRAFKGDQRRFGDSTGSNRVATDLDCERVRRIDDMRDVLIAEIVSQSARAAEAADTNRHRLAGGNARAAAIGIDRVTSGPRQRIGKRMGITCSAQNKGACHV